MNYQKIGPITISVVIVTILAGCGGGSGSADTAATTPPPAPTTLSSVFNDAPVKGVCFSANPSKTVGATGGDGSYQYVAGDTVTFYLDGSGAGCTGTSSSSATSIALGSYAPNGGQTFVLALPEGEFVAETLTALNHGSASGMDVSGVKIAQAQIDVINNYISSSGTVLPTSAGGSVDLLFNGVQTGTTLASGTNGAPTFVVPLMNATASSSTLQTTVAGNLQNTAANGLGSTPTSIAIPAGALRFSVNTSTYTKPLSATPTTNFVTTRARFNYYNGNGDGASLMSLNSTQFAAHSWVTSATLPAMTETFTYSVPASGNTFTKVLSGTASNGNTFTQSDTTTVSYQDSGMNASHNSYSKTYTSGPNKGNVFEIGTSSSSARNLTPLTLAMLAGKAVTQNNQCGSGQTLPNVYTFSADGTSMTQTCGAPSTVSTTSIPGILLVTDSNGTITYLGLLGTGVVTGASFVFIQENPGNANQGSPAAWGITPPFPLVK